MHSCMRTCVRVHAGTPLLRLAVMVSAVIAEMVMAYIGMAEMVTAEMFMAYMVVAEMVMAHIQLWPM